jgi:hypothetical protein
VSEQHTFFLRNRLVEVAEKTLRFSRSCAFFESILSEPAFFKKLVLDRSLSSIKLGTISLVDSFSTHLFSKDWSSDPSPLSIGLGSIEEKPDVVFKRASKEKKKKDI